MKDITYPNKYCLLSTLMDFNQSIAKLVVNTRKPCCLVNGFAGQKVKMTTCKN